MKNEIATQEKTTAYMNQQITFKFKFNMNQQITFKFKCSSNAKKVRVGSVVTISVYG